MKWLNKILACLAFLSTVAAVVFGARAKQKQADAKSAEQRADIAEAANETHTRVQRAKEALNEKHKAENDEAEASVARGDRDHFDNQW